MLAIPETMLRQMVRHAENDYPHECCGLLMGPEKSPDALTKIFPCQNVQDEYHDSDPSRHPRDSRTAYFMDPEQLLNIKKTSARDGLVLRVIYHSHIDTEAYFSDEDNRAAVWDDQPVHSDVCYLVFSVKKGHVVEYALYAWDQKKRVYCEVLRKPR